MRSEEEIKKEIVELEEKMLSSIKELISKLRVRKSKQKSEKSRKRHEQYLDKRRIVQKTKLKLLQAIFKELEDKKG